MVGIALGYWVASTGGRSEAGASPELPATNDAAPANMEASVSTGKVQSGDDSVQPEETTGISEAWLESLESKGSFERFGMLHERLKSVPPYGFKPLIESLAGMAGTSLTWQAQSLIAARWAEVDPQGLRQYMDTRPTNQQWVFIGALYSTWAEKDPDAALAATRDMTNWNMRQNALSSIAAAVAKKDPLRAVAIVQEHTTGSMHGDWVMRNVFEQWAKRDPDAARQAALAMKNGPAKSSALAGAMGEWMAAEPMAALTWLDSLPTDSVIHRAREELLSHLASKDLNVAKQYIESRATPLSRKEALENMHLANIIWSQDAESIHEAIDWLGTVAKGQLYHRKVQELVGALAQADPDSAIEFMQGMSPGEARMGVISSIAGKLSDQNPSQALEFISNLEYEDERERALQRMSWRFARNNVETASTLISESGDPLVQQQLVRGIAEEWSSYDTDAALAWVEKLEDEQARSNGLEAVLANWVQKNPAEAMAYVESSIDEAEQGNAYTNLFNQWIREDAETAIQYLEKMPEIPEEQQSRLFGNVTRNFFRQDPMAASKWVETLEAGPARDQSVEVLVKNVSNSDPEAGFIWAQTLGDDGKRKRSLKQSLQQLVQRDPEAAKKAVDAADLPEEEKKPLLEILEDSK